MPLPSHTRIVACYSAFLLDFVNATPPLTAADTQRFRSALNRCALTGELPPAQWPVLKRLISIEFYSILVGLLASSGQTIPLEDGEPWETRARRIVSIIDRWDTPPFTAQRLCELILQQHLPPRVPVFRYTSPSKFLLAFSKSVCGVTARPADPTAVPVGVLPLGSFPGALAAAPAVPAGVPIAPAPGEEEVVFFDGDGNALELLLDDDDVEDARLGSYYLSQSALTAADPLAYGPNPGSVTPRSATPTLVAGATAGAAGTEGGGRMMKDEED